MNQMWYAPVGTSIDKWEGWTPIGAVNDSPIWAEEAVAVAEDQTLAAWMQPHTITFTVTVSPRTIRFLRRLHRQLSARERDLHCAYRRRILARRRRHRHHR